MRKPEPMTKRQKQKAVKRILADAIKMKKTYAVLVMTDMRKDDHDACVIFDGKLESLTVLTIDLIRNLIGELCEEDRKMMALILSQELMSYINDNEDTVGIEEITERGDK